MTSYPNSGRRTLSDSHRRDLERGSAIPPDVYQGRGTFSTRRGRDVPQDHGWLPRKPGIVFPVHLLDGGTLCRLRPDNPGRFPKYMQPKGYPNRLDVHPRQHDLIKRPGGMRYVTEGEKKVDSGVSHGLLMVGLSGVWNGQKDKALIPDWHLLPLEGERYSITFDSDITSNPNVQMAADRQARLLREQGAEVFLTLLLPAPDGGKQGLDDFFANGGTVKELELLTSPYSPQTVERARLTRDKKLQAGVAHLWRDWYERNWMQFVGGAESPNWQRGHTARDVMEVLIRLAPKVGKVDERGIVIDRTGLRRIAELSAKSAPSVGQALKHLEADGQLEILPPEDRSKARSYRLLAPSATFYTMEEGYAEGSGTEEGARRCKGLRYPSAPRLRWSSPAPLGNLVRSVEGATGRTVTEAIGENVFAPSDYRPYSNRLGPHRGAILDTLEAAGGEMHLKDLCEALHRKRPWDVRRRILKPLEDAGIIECEGDLIRLVDGWMASLDERREKDGEIEQAERQAKKHREQGQSYRVFLQRQKNGTPEASYAAVRRSHELRDRRTKEAREEEERRRSAVPQGLRDLVTRLVNQNGRLGMGLLRGIATEEGYHFGHVPRAVEELGLRVERLAEFGNEPFVFAAVEGAA
jgi:hypothetical protein